MSSSGLYNFNPAVSGITMLAFARIGIRRTEITAQHLADAELEANFTQVALGTRQPNLWRQELFTQVLTESDATYDLPVRMIAIRDVYMTVTNNGVSTDRAIWPLSTSEYDFQPNKTLEAVPTAYFVNKLMQPTITMWPVPDDSATYTINVRLLSQIQDASLANGITLDLPYRALDVYVAGLAHRLSRIYAKELEMQRKQDYMDAWQDFANTDTEDMVGLTVAPDFSGYYRR